MVKRVVEADDVVADLLRNSKQLTDWDKEQLLALIADNPAGQDRQLTPFILIREI